MRIRSHLFLFVVLFACVQSVLAQARTGVGLRTIEVQEPRTGTVMPAMVFHPTVEDTATTKVGTYEIEGEFSRPTAPGKHPLVLLSHGHGGSAVGHHPLAVSLARAGYIVAAIEHAGDSYRDQSGFGTDRVLLGRAWQISALLDTLMKAPELGERIDADRIGVAGFSAGGYTSLLLLGATPDGANHAKYCTQLPQDEELCVLSPSKAIHFDQSLQTTDPRIRSAFVMSPLAVFFDKESLGAVTRPVFVHAAMADAVLKPRWNALAVRHGVRNLRGWRGIVGADHYVYLAPCPASMARSVPELCRDPAGIDRERLQVEVAESARSFFDETLLDAGPR